MYEQVTEKKFCIYKENSKDFNNPITCIDVHPRRPELVVMGYEKGQITVFNIITQKNIK